MKDQRSGHDNKSKYTRKNMERGWIQEERVQVPS
jgi:hypothetical protein